MQNVRSGKSVPQLYFSDKKVRRLNINLQQHSSKKMQPFDFLKLLFPFCSFCGKTGTSRLRTAVVNSDTAKALITCQCLTVVVLVICRTPECLVYPDSQMFADVLAHTHTCKIRTYARTPAHTRKLHAVCLFRLSLFNLQRGIIGMILMPVQNRVLNLISSLPFDDERIPDMIRTTSVASLSSHRLLMVHGAGEFILNNHVCGQHWFIVFLQIICNYSSLTTTLCKIETRLN